MHVMGNLSNYSKIVETQSSIIFLSFSKKMTKILTTAPSPSSLSSGAGVPGVILLMLLFALCLWYCRKRHAAPNILTRNISCEPFSKFDLEDGGVCFEVPVFSYVELEKATNKFDRDKELGDGGFGTVYHGKRKTLLCLLTFVELRFEKLIKELH